MRRKRTSGPITVIVLEGMVEIARREYTDSLQMRTSVRHSWPRWIAIALGKAERGHAKRVKEAARVHG